MMLTLLTGLMLGGMLLGAGVALGAWLLAPRIAVEGEEIEPSLLAQFLKKDEKGDFIQANSVETYLKEHEGEDVSIGKVLNEDD